MTGGLFLKSHSAPNDVFWRCFSLSYNAPQNVNWHVKLKKNQRPPGRLNKFLGKALVMSAKCEQTFSFQNRQKKEEA